ncbi:MULTISPECIES: hypothetical protein [Clostridium]|uniref:DUF3784 domain-containing protein n=1 Tax=Clostridium ragsdalei P11 TaxID=1353534 RepID=A0A1A6B055_9CLOT|nr:MULTISPECIES: hypothetical protein [Clostridium]OBR95721.1 hypothetical protein CLRAG_07850 [Clostridium ragsdalei P11]QXE20147.1 hypothetical protein B5S50_15655 [Clostridium sp. 001]
MDSAMTGLLMFMGFMGVMQGLGMKHSKAVRTKFKLDAEGVDKKYVNFKANFLIILGGIILIFQLIIFINPTFGNRLEIMLPAVLLVGITWDFIYKKTRFKHNDKKK